MKGSTLKPNYAEDRVAKFLARCTSCLPLKRAWSTKDSQKRYRVVVLMFGSFTVWLAPATLRPRTPCLVATCIPARLLPVVLVCHFWLAPCCSGILARPKKTLKQGILCAIGQTSGVWLPDTAIAVTAFTVHIWCRECEPLGIGMRHATSWNPHAYNVV